MQLTSTGKSLNSEAQNSADLPVTGNREGPVLMGMRVEHSACSWGTAGFRREETEGAELTYLVSPSELTIQIRSCTSTGVECVDGVEPGVKPQERGRSVPLSSAFKRKRHRNNGGVFPDQLCL